MSETVLSHISPSINMTSFNVLNMEHMCGFNIDGALCGVGQHVTQLGKQVNESK